MSKSSRFFRLSATATFLISFAAVGYWAMLCAAAEPFHYTPAKQAPAELRYIEGIPVLVAAGTPDEMGRQIGSLSATGLKSLLGHQDDFYRGLGLPRARDLVVQAGQLMLPKFPADQRLELDAIAKASDMPADILTTANVMYEFSRLRGCSVLMVEPGRSTTGGPLFGRNFDFPTFGFLDRYSMVVVYRGKGKHAFASVTFPGLVGCVSGLTDVGLCRAVLVVNLSNDGAPRFDPAGVPIEMCFRRVMEECKTVDEAEKLLRSLKRSSMCNLAICDLHDAAVLEITPKTVARRPGVDGLCSCTNHFRTPELTTGVVCQRYNALEMSRQLEKLDVAAVAHKLDVVNEGRQTIQTMIFEPAKKTLYLSIGPRPSSSQPLKKIDLTKLFESASAAEPVAKKEAAR